STPLHNECAPGQPAAEPHKDDLVAAFDLALLNRLDCCDRNGSRGSISIAVHVDHELVHRHLEIFGGSLDDSEVCLMWNDPLHIVGGHPGEIERLLGRMPHDARGKSEYGLAIHL